MLPVSPSYVRLTFSCPTPTQYFPKFRIRLKHKKSHSSTTSKNWLRTKFYELDRRRRWNPSCQRHYTIPGTGFRSLHLLLFHHSFTTTPLICRRRSNFLHLYNYGTPPTPTSQSPSHIHCFLVFNKDSKTIKDPKNRSKIP